MKRAVINKWLKFMKQIFTTKVLLFRKTINAVGFRDRDCLTCFKQGVATGFLEKQKLMNRFFDTANKDNYENKIEFFVSQCQEDYIKELPPLLNPEFCREIKMFEKALAAHKQWCTKTW